MSSVADRRRAFAWLDLEALERIDAHAPEVVAAGVRNVYLALAQTAARRYDGDHAGFEASRPELAAVARTSAKTIDRHIAELERLGLVVVERRIAANGSPLPSRYVLVDPPAEAPGHEVPTLASSSPQGGDTEALPVSPLRARPDAVKEKEEGESERARVLTDPASQENGTTETAERAVVADLSAVLAERGRDLTARERLGIRSVLHAAPAGVDGAAAAARLRAAYGPEGKAANRPVADAAGLLAEEIRRSTPERAVEPRTRRGGRDSTNPDRDTSETPERKAAREASYLRVHDVRPAALEPASKVLERVWEWVYEVLDGHHLMSYIGSVGLAGEMSTLVTDVEHGEQIQKIIVLEAARDELAEVSRNGRRITSLFERALEAEGVTVEVTPRSDAQVAAA